MMKYLYLKLRDIFQFSFNLRMFLSFGALIIVSVLSSLYICLFGFPYTSIEGIYNKSLSQMEGTLEFLADSKKQHMVKWVFERRGDVKMAANSFRANAKVERLLSKMQGYKLGNPKFLIERLKKEEEYRELTSYFDEIQASYHGQYEEIYIVDAMSGTIIVSTKEDEVGSYSHINAQDIKSGQDGFNLVASSHSAGINLVISRAINICAEVKPYCITDATTTLSADAATRAGISPAIPTWRSPRKRK
ncbi:hypothetical protein MBAV_002699 [Candidatus Magnetobacterium bavaricum]|uniref:Uncharacterized protein n=1 Tax=Candidatus Magnetobacterium bavaricum TaxID=29290 RepID=A0A0F3GTE0_9BACT|nr:hypothetical protein MBAV_002699 [Candidatus Magnetobacterium bavaricum]